MSEPIAVAIPTITFALMTVVGIDLTRADFERVARAPRVVVAGLLGPLVLLPPLAALLIALLDPPPSVQAGVLLIAACPVGGISNTYVYLAGASTALSVTLTGLSSLLATVTIPALSMVFERVLGRPLGVSVPPGLLLAQLAGIIAAPVAIGMTVRAFAPAWSARNRRRLRAGAFVALGALVVFVVVEARGEFWNHLAVTAAASAAFVIGAVAVGTLVGAAVARSRADRFTIAVEFATRNVAIAATVAVTLAGRVDLAVVATTYLLTEAPIMLGAIGIYRRLGAE